MDILETNKYLTPFKVCQCILLHEALTNKSYPKPLVLKLLGFIVSQTQFPSSKEPSLEEFLNSIKEVQHEYFLEVYPSDSVMKIIDDLKEFSNLLHLIIVRLNELKSEGEVGLYMEQGGVLYFFLRKCFLAFARMGFEDLTKLHRNLQNYKQGTYSSTDFDLLASELAKDLDKIVLEKPYSELSSEIESLPNNSKHILKTHLDVMHNKISAIDSLHTYFDLVLDTQKPTKTSRERGLVVVQSSTHYASLHRIKAELELGHLESALHLLVETTKRALSEKDNSVILECSLLFMKVAGITGKHTQEQRINENAILHSLKLGYVLGLVKSTLTYLQLETYRKVECKDILKEIKSTPTKKTTFGMQEKCLVQDPNSSTPNTLADYTIVEAQMNFLCEEFFRDYRRIQVLKWIKKGNKTMADQFLEKSSKKANTENLNFYLLIARIKVKFSKQECLELLDFVDKHSAEKSCIDWEYSVHYIGQVWATFKGEFLEAEFFETQAIDKLNSNRESTQSVLVQKLYRLLLQSNYVAAQELAVSVMSQSPNNHILSEVFMYLSQIYLATNQVSEAMNCCNKALCLSEGNKMLEVLCKLTLADIYIEAYRSCVPALQLLTTEYKELAIVGSDYLSGKFHSCFAKCLLGLAKQAGGYSGEALYQKGLFCCDLAVQFLEKLECDWEIREVKYMQARAFHLLGNYLERDRCSAEFVKLNQQLKWAAKKTVSLEKGISLK